MRYKHNFFGGGEGGWIVRLKLLWNFEVERLKNVFSCKTYSNNLLKNSIKYISERERNSYWYFKSFSWNIFSLSLSIYQPSAFFLSIYQPCAFFLASAKKRSWLLCQLVWNSKTPPASCKWLYAVPELSAGLINLSLIQVGVNDHRRTRSLQGWTHSCVLYDGMCWICVEVGVIVCSRLYFQRPQKVVWSLLTSS